MCKSVKIILRAGRSGLRGGSGAAGDGLAGAGELCAGLLQLCFDDLRVGVRLVEEIFTRAINLL